LLHIPHCSFPSPSNTSKGISHFLLHFRHIAISTMDPLSISAATMGFVAFILQVATTADGFIRDAKGFPDEFIKLASDTRDFADLVERLKLAINMVEARYTNANQADGIKQTLGSPAEL